MTLKSWITTKENDMRERPPIHPGETLQEFLEDYNITAYRLAKDTGMQRIRVSQILKGERSITADTALRLGRYFGVSAGYWMGLQSRHDVELAKMMIDSELEQIPVLVEA